MFFKNTTFLAINSFTCGRDMKELRKEKMTKRITETMHIDDLPKALASSKSVARARESVKSTKDTNLQAIASKLAANAIVGESAIVIELPLPPSTLSPNWRGHWAEKSKAVKAYREMAFVESRKHRVKFKQANYFFIFKVARKQDADNLAASMKAALDGLQDAGIIANDSGLHPMGSELFSGKKYMPFGVRIILWERVNMSEINLVAANAEID